MLPTAIDIYDWLRAEAKGRGVREERLVKWLGRERIEKLFSEAVNGTRPKEGERCGHWAIMRLMAVWERNGPFTISGKAIGVSKPASYIYLSVQEPGIDGWARTNLRFS